MQTRRRTLSLPQPLKAFNDSAVPLPLDEESDLDLYGELMSQKSF